MVQSGFIIGGSRTDSENLIVDGAAAEHQLPVKRTGRLVECRRNKDDLSTAVCHQAGKFRKAEIVADAQSHFAPFRIKNGNFISGR